MHRAIVLDCLDAIEHLPLVVFYLLRGGLVRAENHPIPHLLTLALY